MIRHTYIYLKKFLNSISFWPFNYLRCFFLLSLPPPPPKCVSMQSLKYSSSYLCRQHYLYTYRRARKWNYKSPWFYLLILKNEDSWRLLNLFHLILYFCNILRDILVGLTFCLLSISIVKGCVRKFVSRFFTSFIILTIYIRLHVKVHTNLPLSSQSFTFGLV